MLSINRLSGILTSIMGFEEAEVPLRTYCGSKDTADIQIGIIGRTIYIAAATNKVKLISNPPKPGNYFCNECWKFLK